MEKHQKTPKSQTSPLAATEAGRQTANQQAALTPSSQATPIAPNNPEHYPNPLTNYHKPIYWLPGQLAELVKTITDKTGSTASQTVILIDGGSGAGKTTFATQLASLIGGQLISMDSFYPGWNGLKAASEIVTDQLLRPNNRGYRRWCWETMQPKEWVPIPEGKPLIIEGCGAISKKSVAKANWAIWYEASWEYRQKSLAGRADANYYQPHWQTWLAQEKQHWAENDPANLADVWVQRKQ